MTDDGAPDHPTNYWAVMAGRTGADHTEEFIREGKWVNHFADTDDNRSLVRAMAPGDRVALRRFGPSAPFTKAVTRRKQISAMHIVATGVIEAHSGDGLEIQVAWEVPSMPAVWFFYTYTRPVWRIIPRPQLGSRDNRSALIHGAFHGSAQRVYNTLGCDDYWRLKRVDIPPDQGPWAQFAEEVARALEKRRTAEARRDLIAQAGDLFAGLRDIDPFSVLAVMHRDEDVDLRLQAAARLGKALGVELPTDATIEGVPPLCDPGSRFASPPTDPNPDETEALWEVYAAAFEYLHRLYGDDPAPAFAAAYDRAVQVPGVGWNLATGLFWATPWEFPPLDRDTRHLIAKDYPDLLPGGADGPILDGAGYLRLVEALHPRTLTAETRFVNLPALAAKASVTKVDPVQDASAWIFQANPTLWDIDRAVHEADQITYRVAQNRDRIKAGHRVYLWRTGPDGSRAGIVATARVATDPTAPGDLPDEPDSYWLDSAAPMPASWSVVLDEIAPLAKTVTRDRVKAHPALSDLPNLVRPQGTNFPVSRAHDDALRRLIAEDAPPPSFDSVAAGLRASGLYVPDETLATYLLALQTKRLVILGGISGTGKTRLAMAIAEAFAPQAPGQTPSHPANFQTSPAPVGGVTLAVSATAIARRRIMLPIHLADELGVPADVGRSIDVHYAGRKATVRTAVYARRNRLRLGLPGDLGDWFQATFRVGGSLAVRVVEPEGNQAAELHLAPLAPEAGESNPSRVALIAVRPDWTDNRQVLGYFNPLHGTYHPTPFLRLLLDARDEAARAARENRPARPYFAIFDEMNLARVEHYFSDFLSALESGEAIDLHDDDATAQGQVEEGVPIPRKLFIPANVYLTGTVNVDETTYMFSPKVLDRAFVMEFDHVDLEAYGRVAGGELFGKDGDAFDLPAFTGIDGAFRAPDATDWRDFGAVDGGAHREALIDLHTALGAEHRHFGYRVANEIARFVTLAHVQSGERPGVAHDAFDIAVVAKVLPKFHGTRRDVEAALHAVFWWATTGRSGAAPSGNDQEAGRAWEIVAGRLVRRPKASNPSSVATSGAAPADDALPPVYPRTALKTWRMLNRLEGGFTSFME